MINFATIVIGKMDTDEIRKHIEHYKSQDKKMSLHVYSETCVWCVILEGPETS